MWCGAILCGRVPYCAVGYRAVSCGAVWRFAVGFSSFGRLCLLISDNLRDHTFVFLVIELIFILLRKRFMLTIFVVI